MTKKDQNKMKISLDEIMDKIKSKLQNEYDIVVAISRGGILPGILISKFLNIPMEIIYLKLRDDNHKKVFEAPKVVKPFDINLTGKKVILVDDVSNSNLTLNKAKELINSKNITTLVISGNADISLFGPHDRCIIWPWNK